MRTFLNLAPAWDAVPMPQPQHRTPILSFFTGAGFLDLGFEQEGFEVIWSNEYEEWFRKGYAYGMSSTLGRPVTISNCDSIIEVAPGQIEREAFNGVRPPFFGIIGGPPCPDFSVGGKNKGEHGVNGRLSEIYVQRIRELRPAFFVFENVKGLVNTGKHLDYLMRLIRLLQDDGYVVDYLLLNALELGVPQDRERVFLVGISQQWARGRHLGLHPGDREWFRYPRDERYIDAKKRWVWPSTSPFGANSPKPDGIPENLTVWHAIGDLAGASDIANASDCFKAYSKKFTEIPEGATSRKSFKRLHRWRYSPTAAYGNNEVHLHPTLGRRLSVREALRIQSAPDTYCLPEEMPLSFKYKTIGNAVPVRLARAVAHSIRMFMEI